MAQTASTMQPLGTKAPSFSLQNPDGKTVSLASFAGAPATVVMFICNHCPFVKLVKEEITSIAKQYQQQGVAFVAINANDYGAYPDDSPEHMAEDIKEFGYTFEYLIDETQEVAKAYSAACTPDFFVYNKDLALAYRGQMDSSRPGNMEKTDGTDLRNALDLVLQGQKVPEPHMPSIGCNIKWKE